MRSQLYPILFGIPAWVQQITPGANPQVALDFVNNRYWQQGFGTQGFSDVLNLSRASPETVTSSTGLLTYADNNKPALSDLGLAVWQSSTNIALQSQTFDSATWLPNAGSISADQTLAPDNTLTADLYSEDGTSSSLHGPSQIGLSLSSSTTYVFSIYVKYDGRQWLRIAFADSGSALVGSTWFDIQNGIAGGHSFTTGTFVSASTPQLVANGFYRIVIIATTAAASTTGFQVRILGASANNSSSVYTGLNGPAFYVWGSQLEAASQVTPYIPTINTTQIRSADSIQPINILKTIFASPSGWLYGNVGGTPSTNSPTILDKDNSNNTNLYFGTTSTIDSLMSGVDLAATLGSGSSTSAVKALVTWNSSGRSLAGNGGTVTTDSSIPGGVNTPFIGSGGGEFFFYNGNIKQLAGGFSRLSNSQIKSLTT